MKVIGKNRWRGTGYGKFSLEGGLTVGYTYEYNVSSGIEAGGVVGSVEDVELWNANRFDWGLIMMPKS